LGAVRCQSAIVFKAECGTGCVSQYKIDFGVRKGERKVGRVHYLSLNYQLFNQSFFSVLVSRNVNGCSLPVSDIHPLLQGTFLQIDRSRLQFSLFFNGTKSTKGGSYAAPANVDQKSSEDSDGPCETEHPPINVGYALFIGLCFGGLTLVFGPGVSFDNKWGRLCAYLGMGIVWLGLLFWIMWGLFYHYTWGLPPNWIPERWNPCPQSQYRSTVPHVENGNCSASRGVSFTGLERGGADCGMLDLKWIEPRDVAACCTLLAHSSPDSARALLMFGGKKSFGIRTLSARNANRAAR
jgi:hypothetical protein